MSPDSKTIALLSDRAKPGECSAIYLLSMPPMSEPIPITELKKKKKIVSPKWSPDGHYVAFLSPDEMTVEEKSRLASGDDAIVYNAN